MSLQTWKDEFYPVPASEPMGEHKAQIEHSLRKWRGATKENTEKHGVFYEDHTIFDETDSTGKFMFGSESCSLCLNNECHECPIVLSGRFGCNYSYSEYRMSGCDPTPMIAVLENLLEKYS